MNILDWMKYKYLMASTGVSTATVAVLEWAEGHKAIIYFFVFGTITAVAQILKTIRDNKAAKAKQRREEEKHQAALLMQKELHELELKKREQELNQDQAIHEKQLKSDDKN